MPHERDESDDSQEAGGERADMRQAYEDVPKGLLDTDLRGSQGSTNVAGAPQKLAPQIFGNPPDHSGTPVPRKK